MKYTGYWGLLVRTIVDIGATLAGRVTADGVLLASTGVPAEKPCRTRYANRLDRVDSLDLDGRDAVS